MHVRAHTHTHVLKTNIVLFVFPSLQLTAVHNQMHSKGGYEHSSHVPAEATPSGKEVITIVSPLLLLLGGH